MENSFGFRRMGAHDLPAVMEIERLSFPNPWHETTFRGELQNDPISFPTVVVRAGDDRVMGYIIFWKVQDDVQINNIAVHPEARGLGLGEALMRFALETVRSLGAAFVSLEVRVTNTSARRLYDKLGFEVFGVRKGYYTNPDEDAVVMGLHLQ
jgi:[ribosomal protein S18]-alanine N-acetyltransferase